MTLAVIDRLFAKLAGRYGAKWTSQWDDADLLKLARNEWFEKLQYLSVEQFKHGLDSWASEWPPNVMEFVTACTAKPGRPSAAYQDWQPEKIKPSSKKVGRAALRDLRGILAL